MEQWTNIIFADENWFSLNTDSNRTFLWREPGTRYLPSNVREIDHYGGGGIMVWGRHHVEWPYTSPCLGKRVTGLRYRDEVLEPYIRLFRGAVGPEFILMDDNVRPHTALLVDEFLESGDIHRMDWPAKSPDFDLIQHVWDTLGRQLQLKTPL